MKAIFWAGVGTLFPFAMTVLGAALVFLMKKQSEDGPGMGFAAGVMTAASVWSLILPAIEQTAAEGRLPPFLPAAAGIVLGALLLALLDEFTRQRGGERVTHSDFLLLSAITLHNIPEGMAVGLAFALAADGEGLAGAAALALGIGVQNFPEGAAVALPLYQSGQSKLRAFVTGVLSGAVEPLFGVLVVLAAARVHALMPWLLSFAAGAMLYVVAEELLPRAGSRRGTCGFLVGFLFMMVLDVALG